MITKEIILVTDYHMWQATNYVCEALYILNLSFVDLIQQRNLGKKQNNQTQLHLKQLS